MGLRDARRRRRAQAAAAALPPLIDTKLAVVRQDGSFSARDGSTVHSLGYHLLDPIGEFTEVGEDAWLRERGCRLTRVAGLTHHAQAAQDERFAPGSVVVLCPDPANPVDPHAVGVWDASGELQVGFVPAEISEDIAKRIASGEMLGAAVLREYRSEPTGGRRLGLVMLIAPIGTVTLQVAAPADTGEETAGV
jgi:hypothetical protein